MSESIATAIPVVVALVVRDGRVLMGERAPTKVYPLAWEFPGGKVETGEHSIDALSRELHEELHIEIEHPQLWDTEIANYDNGKTYAIEYYVVRTFAPEPYNTEFNQIGWFSVDELRELKHLSGNTNVLARIYREGIPA